MTDASSRPAEHGAAVPHPHRGDDREGGEPPLGPGKVTRTELADRPARRAAGTGAPGKHTLTERAASDPGPPHQAIDELLAQFGGAIRQAKLASEPADPAAQAAAAGGHAGADSPLPAPMRDKMERSFGTSLDSVRVHEGPEAAALGARAYAQGEHIHVAPGQLAGADGESLIGHELTHVLQQRAGRASGVQGKGGFALSPALEAEADDLGGRAARGEQVTVPGTTSAHGGAAAGDVRQPALAAQAEADGIGVHAYTVESEAKPNKTNKQTQATAGHYQHIGEGRFIRVRHVMGAWHRDGGVYYWYDEASRALWEWQARGAPAITPSAWARAESGKKGSGGATGRAVEDQRELAWVVNPDVHDRDRALAVVAGLPIPELKEWSPGWTPVSTIAGSPAQLMVRDTGSEHTGRAADPGTLMFSQADVQRTWAELARRAETVKDSGAVNPRAPLTDRSGRRTDKDFGVSATHAASGKDNAMGKGELAPFEWCHLIGDGDGGSNAADNLNIGTNAANTEQLLLETVQRAAGLRGVLKAHKLTLAIRAKGALARTPEDDNVPWQHQHMGNWFLYEIQIQRAGQPPLPVVTHAYDAQRDKITKNMVRFMMAQTKDLIVSALGTLGVNTTTAEAFGEAKAKKPLPAISAAGPISAPASPADQHQVVQQLAYLRKTHQLDVAKLTALIELGYAPDVLVHALTVLDVPQVQAQAAVDEAAKPTAPKTPEEVIAYELDEAYEDAVMQFEVDLTATKKDRRHLLMDRVRASFHASVAKLPKDLQGHPAFARLAMKKQGALEYKMAKLVRKAG